MQFYEKILKNFKSATLIDRESFKTQNKTKNYKFIKKTRLFTQRQINHCINVIIQKKKIRKRN